MAPKRPPKQPSSPVPSGGFSLTTDGFILTTAGGREITERTFGALPAELKEVIYRGIQMSNLIEEAIVRLADNPTHADAAMDATLLDRTWRGAFCAPSESAIATFIAILLDGVTLDRTTKYTSINGRAQAAEVVVNGLAQVGWVECSVALGAHMQLVADTLGAWWGELRGGKWEALARLLKTALGISRKPDSLRVEYAEFKSKARLYEALAELRDP